MQIKNVVIRNHPFKAWIFFMFLLPSNTLFSQTDSLPFITLNLNVGNSFYTFHNDGIPNTYLSHTTFSPSFSVDIGFRLNDRTQFFIGRHYFARSYRIMNSNPGTYGFVSKDRSTSINSTTFTLSRMLYNQKNTKLFYFTRLGFSKVFNTIQYVYDDSFHVNNYTVRNRQSTSQETYIMASLGFGIEHRFFLKEVYIMSQMEYILSNSFGSATSINRLNLNAGFSFKFY